MNVYRLMILLLIVRKQDCPPQPYLSIDDKYGLPATLSLLQAVLKDRQAQVTEDAEALLIALPDQVLGRSTVGPCHMSGA